MQGRQTCGTGRAIGGRRSHQIEVIGDAVGQHGQADVHHVELGGPAHGAPAGHRWNLSADEEAGPTVAQRMEVPTGAFEGLPGAAQQHPHLGIHQPHFVLGKAEETAVEQLFRVVANQPLVRAGEPTWARKLTDRPVTPAVAVGDRLLDDLALAQETPEVLVRTDPPGHAVAVTHNGHGHLGRRSVLPRSVLSVPGGNFHAQVPRGHSAAPPVKSKAVRASRIALFAAQSLRLGAAG